MATKVANYRWVMEQTGPNSEASFLASVILTRTGPTQAKRMQGLVNLLQKGKDVRFAQFSMDILMVDGKEVKGGMAFLENQNKETAQRLKGKNRRFILPPTRSVAWKSKS